MLLFIRYEKDEFKFLHRKGYIKQQEMHIMCKFVHQIEGIQLQMVREKFKVEKAQS